MSTILEIKMAPTTLNENKYKNYEILSDASVFIPHVYESIWIKIKIKNGPDKIIGNVYRPNTAPLADLSKAISIHNNILDDLQNYKIHSKREIQIFGDQNLNMLNFETNAPTNDYINSLISKSFETYGEFPKGGRLSKCQKNSEDSAGKKSRFWVSIGCQKVPQ